jgi:hypothetical protein
MSAASAHTKKPYEASAPSSGFSRLPLGSHRRRHDYKPNSTTKPLKVLVTQEGFVWYGHRCRGDRARRQSDAVFRAARPQRAGSGDSSPIEIGLSDFGISSENGLGVEQIRRVLGEFRALEESA